MPSATPEESVGVNPVSRVTSATSVSLTTSIWDRKDASL